MTVTSHQVARLAGVSQPTVSRALRDSPKVSEATKKRVRAAAEALGYVPSDTGRALASGRTQRIGLLVTDLENQFYHFLIAPMHHELEKLGYQLVLMTETSDSPGVAERLTARVLDGVILATTTTDSVLPVRLRDRHVPFVYFNRVSLTVQADSVIVDPAPGIREAVAQMASLGHQRVGAIFGPSNTSTGILRAEVLRDTLRQEGVGFDPALGFSGQFDFDTGAQGARELLSAASPPTVIFCANDVIALGALNAARELGVDVPAELSIVGFDDLPVAAWSLVRLTTVAYDLEGMARAAAATLVRRLTNEDAPYERSVFTSKLILRGTLGRAPR